MLHLGRGRLGPEQRCQRGRCLDRSPRLERPAGGIDQAVQGQPPGLGPDRVDRGVAGGGVLAEPLDEAKEPPRVWP